MQEFSYEAPFMPARPRKKRKNRGPPERRDPAVALKHTIQELAAGGWFHDCMSEPSPM